MFTLCPCNPDFIDTLEFLLKFIGACGAAILFFIGFARYKRDQKWKRLEFIAKEMKDFNNDHKVCSVMHILDFSSRNIELYPEKPNYEDRFVHVDRELLRKALINHDKMPKDNGKDRFTEEEVALRDHFDHFLSYFERFEHFILTGLVSKEELQPYLNYWIILITQELEGNTRSTLYEFIDKYRYNGTQNMFERFGFNIKPSKIV